MITRLERGLYWDRAWKLTEGCTKVSPGCANCWSERESAMRSKNPNPKISERFDGVLTDSGKWNGKIRMREDNLDLPLRIKKPTRFAIWNDLFHEDVGGRFINQAWMNIRNSSPKHKYFILTKRPEILLRWTEIAAEYKHWPIEDIWPDNVSLGTTVENQEQADKRIPILLHIPAKIRFVSVEPMLEPIDLVKDHDCLCRCEGCLSMARKHPDTPGLQRIDWAIIGAESGGPKERRIENNHITNLLLQCSDAKVPVFLKQAWIDGELVKLPNLGGQVWNQLPK